MAIADIQSMYDKLYSSRYNGLIKKKNEDLNNLDAQKNQTADQYKTLYNGLDTQQEQGKQQYSNDRNSAALSNAQKIQQLRDYMASHNLLQSGENVDAQLRANTDYNNNLGTIYNNEQTFNRGITNKRNEYSSQEQNAYDNINKQIKAVNDNFSGDDQALRDEIDAQKLKDILSYQSQVQSAARSSSGSRASSTQEKADKESELNATYATLYQNMDSGYGKQFLNDNRDNIVLKFGTKVYEDMADKVANNTGREQRMAHAREYNMRPQNY